MSDDDSEESADEQPSDTTASDPDAATGPVEEPDSTTESAPTEPTDSEATGQHDQVSGDEAPLSDLANRMRQRHDRSEEDGEEPMPDLDPDLSEGPPSDPDEDPFDRMSVGEIDEETLWESLGSDDPTPDAAALSGVDPAPGVETVGDAGPDTREHVVPKDKYCQSCPYLDDPPELACTHEGTEIVEVLDSERFRVRNCPMVEGGVEPTE